MLAIWKSGEDYHPYYAHQLHGANDGC